MPLNIKLHEEQAQKQVDDTLRSYGAHVCVIFFSMESFPWSTKNNYRTRNNNQYAINSSSYLLPSHETTSLHP